MREKREIKKEINDCNMISETVTVSWRKSKIPIFC